MQVNGHFLPLEYSCCNLLQNCKDTLFTPAFGLFVGQRFRNTAKPLFFPPLYILLVFKVEIKYIEATFAALIKGGCKFAVFCRCFLLYSLRTFCYSVPCSANHPWRCATLHKSGLEFSFSTVAAIKAAVYLLSSFVICFVLKCVAKVVLLFVSCKHFRK